MLLSQRPCVQAWLASATQQPHDQRRWVRHSPVEGWPTTVCRSAAANPGPGDNSVPSQYSGVQPGSTLASQAPEEEPNTEEQLYQLPKTLSRRIRYFLLGDGLDKKRLQQLGVGAVASYGFVSNATYCTGLAVSWIAFVQQRHLSPLMPGQWKAFLAFYAGFWTLQNFLRPFRFSLALTLAPAFNRFIGYLEVRLRLRRQLAFGVYIGLLGAVTTFLTFGSIFACCGSAAFARA